MAGRKEYEADLDAEIRHHMELHAEDLEAEGATGMAEAVRDGLLAYQRAMAEGRTIDALSEATAVVWTSAPTGPKADLPWAGVPRAR